MESSVDFQVLRRESQQIGICRRGSGLAHGFNDVVAVVEEFAAGAIGQLRQNVLLRELRRHAIGTLVTGGSNAVPRRIGNVPHYIRCVEAARINGINHDIGASSAINHFGSFGLQGRSDKTRGYQNQHPLTRHVGQVSNDFFQMPVGILCLAVALRHRAIRGSPRQILSGRRHPRVVVERAS